MSDHHPIPEHQTLPRRVVDILYGTKSGCLIGLTKKLNVCVIQAHCMGKFVVCCKDFFDIESSAGIQFVS